MPQYRCFFMNSDRRILDVDVAEFTDDRAAGSWAAALLARAATDLQLVEVWHRTRWVCRYGRHPVAAND
jgi:hypothetical protein